MVPICRIVCWLALEQQVPEVPSALLAMQRARETLTGRIKWHVLPEGDESRALSFVSRYARNGDMIFENRGDPEGWTVGKLLKYPQIYLRNSDGYWRHQETALSCMWWKELGPISGWRTNVRDVRCVGVFPASASLRCDYGFGLIWNNPNHKVVSWEQRRSGDVYVVTAQCDTGAELTWYINPDKGWNAERITCEMNARREEAICTLRRYGDTWLPETTGYCRDGKLIDVVRIRSAAVNRPDDPARLTLADMGVEPGSEILPQDPDAQMEKVMRADGLRWNGEAVCRGKEWYADVEAGRRQWGPTWQRLNRGEEFYSPYETDEMRAERQLQATKLKLKHALEQHEYLWLSYVRDFIARYELDEQQEARAMRILADCRERAERVLKRARPELLALEAQLQEAAAQRRQEELEKLTARIDELKSPINRIFRDQLVPRLERIPTEAQREAAAARADADVTEKRPQSRPSP